MTVHDPVEGKPCSTTLPVGLIQVGWVTVPATGIVGLVNTEKGVLPEQPSEVLTYVKVTEPAAIPVTTPELVMEAMEGLLDVHVPLEEGVTLAVEPIHTEVAPPGTGFDGIGSITTLFEEIDVQLFWFLTTKEYVVFGAKPETV